MSRRFAVTTVLVVALGPWPWAQTHPVVYEGWRQAAYQQGLADFHRIWGDAGGRMSTIVHQLEHHSGRRFPVIPSETGNWGQSHPGGVILFDISASTLDDAVVAGLLAHEWGHQVLGHPQRVRLTFDPAATSAQMRQFEREADAYAARFLAAWGYDAEPLARFLESAPPEWGSHIGIALHDEGAARAHAVRGLHRQAQAESESVVLMNQGPTTMVPCPVCGGLGRRLCSGCGGNGALWTSWGWSVCSPCGGQGATVCDRCSGSGTVAGSAWTPFKWGP